MTGANGLTLSVIHRQLHIATLLATTCPAMLNDCDFVGKTPKNSSLLRFCMQDGRTALHYAALVAQFSHDFRFYDLLIANEANKFVKDAEGYTPQAYLHEHAIVESLGALRFMNECAITCSNVSKSICSDPLKLFDDIERWIHDGRVDELENLILEGQVSTNTPNITHLCITSSTLLSTSAISPCHTYDTFIPCLNAS